MHTEHKREDPLVDIGYETRDINYSGLGKMTIIFFVFCFFCFGVVGIWFYIAQPKVNSALDPRKPMPSITLQSNIAVRADIQTLRQHETEVLSSTAQNPDGSFHLPIDKAMAVIASRGLGHSVSAVTAVSPGNTIKQNALAPTDGQMPAPGGAPSP